MLEILLMETHHNLRESRPELYFNSDFNSVLGSLVMETRPRFNGPPRCEEFQFRTRKSCNGNPPALSPFASQVNCSRFQFRTRKSCNGNPQRPVPCRQPHQPTGDFLPTYRKAARKAVRKTYLTDYPDRIPCDFCRATEDGCVPCRRQAMPTFPR